MAVDRTQDFLNVVSAQVAAGVHPVSTLPVGGAGVGVGGGVVRRHASKTEHARVFAGKASEISKKIQLTTKRLQQLASLTRRQGTFDDPGQEINSLAARLQNDTKFLKIELDQLQSYLNRNRQQVGHGSHNASDHSQKVVETMSMQLASATMGFKTVLEQRQSSMKKKSDRRGLYGDSNHNRGRAAAPPSQSAMSLPRPAGVELGAVHSRNGNGLNGNEANGGLTDDYDDLEGPSLLIQPVVHMQDNSYLSSRAEAMSTIETYISDLGDIFGQLNEMVAEQGSLVDRIDENVRDTEAHVDYARMELLRTWANVSNNRWLAAKVTFILLFFMTFFVVFLA